MNINDMNIIQMTGKMEVTYYRSPVSKAVLYYSKKIVTIHYPDRDPVTVDVSVIPGESIDSYCVQFGIVLSDVGDLFFLQSWEKGLYCFEIATGVLRWHYKLSRAFETATKDRLVFCRFVDKCLCVFDADTGTLLKRRPMGVYTTLKVLSNNYFLSGPKRNKYEVLNWDLEVVEHIPVKELNPYEDPNFCILCGDLSGNQLTISGWEKSKSPESTGGTDRFRRTVTLKYLTD